MAKVKLTDLILDYELYPRNDVSSQVVTALCDAIEMGDPIPAIIADKKTKRIADGFHRYEAHKRLKLEEIEVNWRQYANEAELFADAVRLNRAHGRAFDPYDLRRSVQKLAEFGLKLRDISEIVRVPQARIEQFTGEFAKGPGGSTVVIKRGLVQELKGRQLTKSQVVANDRFSGYQPTYHVNQLIRILEAGIVPKVQSFRDAMDALTELWTRIRQKKSA